MNFAVIRYLLVIWFESFCVRVSTITAIDCRSQYVYVHTDERTQQVHSAQSSLVVTHPSTNRCRRALTSVEVALS